MTGIMCALAGGAGGPVVNPLVGGTASDAAADPGDAEASWRFNPDGTVDLLRANIGNVLNQQQWYRPTGGTPGAGYWVRMTVNSGSTPSGSPTATWLQLNAARTFTVTRTTAGTNTSNCTVEIALDSGGVSIVTSGSFLYNSQVFA